MYDFTEFERQFEPQVPPPAPVADTDVDEHAASRVGPKSRRHPPGHLIPVG